MKQRSKIDPEDRAERDLLTEVLRSSAQKLLAPALEPEMAELLAAFADQWDTQGHARVVKSGHHPARDLQTGLGPVTVQVPKMRSRQGEPVTLRSAFVPPYVRKTQRLKARLALVVFEGDLDGGDAGGIGNFSGPRGHGSLSQYGGPVETAVASGV